MLRLSLWFTFYPFLAALKPAFQCFFSLREPASSQLSTSYLAQLCRLGERTCYRDNSFSQTCHKWQFLSLFCFFHKAFYLPLSGVKNIVIYTFLYSLLATPALDPPLQPSSIPDSVLCQVLSPPLHVGTCQPSVCGMTCIDSHRTALGGSK